MGLEKDDQHRRPLPRRILLTAPFVYLANKALNAFGAEPVTDARIEVLIRDLMADRPRDGKGPFSIRRAARIELEAIIRGIPVTREELDKWETRLEFDRFNDPQYHHDAPLLLDQVKNRCMQLFFQVPNLTLSADDNERELSLRDRLVLWGELNECPVQLPPEWTSAKYAPKLNAASPVHFDGKQPWQALTDTLDASTTECRITVVGDGIVKIYATDYPVTKKSDGIFLCQAWSRFTKPSFTGYCVAATLVPLPRFRFGPGWRGFPEAMVCHIQKTNEIPEERRMWWNAQHEAPHYRTDRIQELDDKIHALDVQIDWRAAVHTRDDYRPEKFDLSFEFPDFKMGTQISDNS